MIDGLIRRMQRESPDTFLRLYADDTAVIWKDVRKEASILQRVMQDLALAANLKLNIRKCVYIPLFQADEEDPVELLKMTVPHFQHMQCSSSGKYLG